MVKKVSFYLSIILIIIIFLIGIALISSIFFPFSIIKPKIDSLAVDGSFDFFSLKFYTLLKFIGIGLILLGGLSGFLIKKIQLFFNNQFLGAGIFFKEINKRIKYFIKEEEKLHLTIFFYILFL